MNWVWHDGQRLTPAMLYDFLNLDADFFARTGCHLRISSGVRTDAEQEQIFRDRYVPTNQVNGRRVYDYRWWNGVQWARISSAGTVAVPGTSNHQISGSRRGALDLYDTGSDAGLLTRGSFRANVFDSIAGAYGYDSEGYGFGENWHKRYNWDPWRAVPSGGGSTPPPPPPPPPPPVGGNMFLIYDSVTYPTNDKARQYVLVTVDGGQFRCNFLEDDYFRAVVLAATPKIPIAPCDRITFEGFLERCGYKYGTPIPLVEVEAAGVSVDAQAVADALAEKQIGGASADEVRAIVAEAISALVLKAAE